MYAIVKVGGKQHRVEQGDTLLVDRLSEDEGAKITLAPLLVRPDSGDPLTTSDQLSKAKVEATVVGHERGEKLHVLKFKPKRGYKRRQGHRSELTRLEIAAISAGAKAPAKAKAKAADKVESEPEQPAGEEATDGS